MIVMSDSLWDLRPAVEAFLGRPVAATEELALSLKDVLNGTETLVEEAFRAGQARERWETLGGFDGDPDEPPPLDHLIQQHFPSRRGA